MKTKTVRTKAIRTMTDLLVHALAMEQDACERYGELADQMVAYNNAEVADLFRRLEGVEKEHVSELQALCQAIEMPRLAPWEYRWPGAESPETIDVSRVHYQMSPREAVLLAFEHERQAAAFYRGIAATAKSEDVKSLANRLADEELAHQQWLDEWLVARGPAADRGMDDPDPPNSLE